MNEDILSDLEEAQRLIAGKSSCNHDHEPVPEHSWMCFDCGIFFLSPPLINLFRTQPEFIKK